MLMPLGLRLQRRLVCRRWAILAISISTSRLLRSQADGHGGHMRLSAVGRLRGVMEDVIRSRSFTERGVFSFCPSFSWSYGFGSSSPKKSPLAAWLSPIGLKEARVPSYRKGRWQCPFSAEEAVAPAKFQRCGCRLRSIPDYAAAIDARRFP